MSETLPTFEQWLRAVSHCQNSNEPGEIDEAWRPWLRAFFDENGAASREAAVAAAETRQLAVATDAVAAALADVHFATTFRPAVTADIYEHALRITIDESWHTGVVFEFEPAAALAEIADHLQEQLDDECWPVCGQHNAGLHAQVRDGVAVWWCRVGTHSVAPIGELERSG